MSTRGDAAPARAPVCDRRSDCCGQSSGRRRRLVVTDVVDGRRLDLGEVRRPRRADPHRDRVAGLELRRIDHARHAALPEAGRSSRRHRRSSGRAAGRASPGAPSSSRSGCAGAIRPPACGPATVPLKSQSGWCARRRRGVRDPCGGRALVSGAWRRRPCGCGPDPVARLQLGEEPVSDAMPPVRKRVHRQTGEHLVLARADQRPAAPAGSRDSIWTGSEVRVRTPAPRAARRWSITAGFVAVAELVTGGRR